MNFRQLFDARHVASIDLCYSNPMSCLASFFDAMSGVKKLAYFRIGNELLSSIIQYAEDIRAGAWKLQKGSGCFKNSVAGINLGLINSIALLN